MTRLLGPALRLLLVLTLVAGVLYPLVITGIAQLAAHRVANGSLVERDGRPVGSELLGQAFTAPEYFHPRPSAAGDGYDPLASGASNLGPLNAELAASVTERVQAYREENSLAADAPVPVDAVTASGSGLDPHISAANARLQAARVADVRGIPGDEVLHLVNEHTSQRTIGVLGEPGVNVLLLNLALDEAT